MPPENLQQPEHGAVLLFCEHARVEIRFPCFGEINVHSPFHQFSRDAIEMKFLWLLQENLSGLQKTYELIADANRHRAVGKPGKARDGARTIAHFGCKLALHF